MVKAASGPKIIVDKEFAGLIPAISADEFSLLEENVRRDGCIDKLIVWEHNGKLILLDGHNRFKLCNEHGIAFAARRMVFDTREEAKNWVINHQLGRRNISDEQRRYLLGCLWRAATKAPVGRPAAGNSETVSELNAREIAEQNGVTDRTVRNAAEFAEAVDALGEKSPELKRAVLAGNVKATAAQLEALAEAPTRVIAAVAKKAAAGDKAAVKDAVAAISEDAEPEEDESADVPNKLKPAFATQGDFRGAVQAIGKIVGQLGALQSTPGGAFLAERFNEIETDLKNAQRAIKFCMPEKICPYCKGRGCKARAGQKAPCRGTGWTIKGVKGTGE
jgi:hypothetical protein